MPIVHLNAQPSTPALVEGSLDPETLDLLRASVSGSTWRTYERDLATITAWTRDRGVRAMPATPSTVANYVGAMSKTLAASTIERRVASWSSWHEANGATDEANPCRSVLVRKSLQGLRRTTPRPREAQPLRVEDLRLLLDVIDPSNLVGLRDRALLTVGLALGRRRSELVSLDVEDLLRVDQPRSGYTVTLRRSKTDQEGRGESLWLPRSGGPACPSVALDAWLAAASITSGPVFRSVTRHGKTGGRLSDRSVSSILARRADEAGLPPGRWSGHSLRAGFVTDAARAGVSPLEIARQTGHSPTSPVLYRYVRIAAPWEANAAAREGWL